jgi:hypothetical protein
MVAVAFLFAFVEEQLLTMWLDKFGVIFILFAGFMFATNGLKLYSAYFYPQFSENNLNMNHFDVLIYGSRFVISIVLFCLLVFLASNQQQFLILTNPDENFNLIYHSLVTMLIEIISTVLSTRIHWYIIRNEHTIQNSFFSHKVEDERLTTIIYKQQVVTSVLNFILILLLIIEIFAFVFDKSYGGNTQPLIHIAPVVMIVNAVFILLKVLPVKFGLGWFIPCYVLSLYAFLYLAGVMYLY